MVGSVNPNGGVESVAVNFNATLVFNIAELVSQVNCARGVMMETSRCSE